MSELKEQEQKSIYDSHPYGESAVADRVASLAPYVDTDVLVAGCGAGKRVLDIAPVARSVRAVDASAESLNVIDQARTRLGIDNINLECADLQTTTFNTEFDHVLCLGVLHHLDDPQIVVTHLADALRPHGCLELLVYHRQSPVYYERRVVEWLNDLLEIGRIVPTSIKHDIEWWDKYENPQWTAYSPVDVKKWCQSAGLEIVDEWLGGEVFGAGTLAILPPVIRMALEQLANRWRFQIHVKAVRRGGVT